MRFAAQAKIAPLDRVHEIVQLGHYFNAREAASSNDECQELAAQVRVLLDIRFLEDVNQVIAQCHGIRERPKWHCIFYHAGHAVKVGDVAERDDQVIVFELDLARTEPGADGYDLSLKIDVLNLAHDQVGAPAKAPNGRNYIGQTDRS